MKTKILTVGHKMPTWVEMGVKDYHKRIQPMMTTDITELAPAKRSKNPSPAEIDKYKHQEGLAILSAHPPKNVLWVLDVKGKMLSTERLADRLQNAMTDGTDISIVIGGTDGISPDVLARADFVWSLSDLTLPHPLVRVVLMEQLYRAMSIIHHHPYHRGE